MLSRSNARLAAIGVVAVLLVGACGSGSTAAPSAAATATAAPTAAATAAPSAEPSAATSLQGKKVAWVLRGFDGYQQAQAASFKAAAEADGVEVSLFNGKDDALAQAKAIDDFIAAGVDGIILQPADPAAAVEPTKAIRAAGIPLVYVGSTPDAGAPKAPFIPFDDMKALTKQAGADAATFVIETLKQTPKLVVFDWVEIPVCHEERMIPFVDGVKSVAPDAQIVFWDTVPANKDQTMAKMEDQLQANPDFNIFTGCGGDLILGGVAGLQAAGRAQAVNKVPKTEWIMTIDGTPEEIDLLLDKSTSIVRTVSQKPNEHGVAVWQTMKKIMLGEIAQDGDAPAEALTTSQMLTSDWTCADVAKEYEHQYGKTDIYKAIDCSKY